MAPAIVWVIGSDHWPRACLRAELIERGLDAIGFVTLRDALARLVVERSAPRSRPALAIVDLHEQPANERGLSTLLAAGFPVIALGGATEWDDPGLRARPWAQFLRRPVTIGAVADAARGILARAATRTGTGGVSSYG
jgi:hypothetical protein